MNDQIEQAAEGVAPEQTPVSDEAALPDTVTGAPDVVVITGACGTLGRAVARAFEAAGASLVLLDLKQASLNAAFGANGPRQWAQAVDLLDAAQTSAALQAALARFGHIDVLCNIAGGFQMGDPVHLLSDQTWDMMLDLNARTVLHTVRAVVPGMIAAGAGKIVNVGAFAALRGAPDMSAYGVSKSAVMRMTEALSGELREHGINVNAVLPTIIDTPENRRGMPDADPSRWVAPDDLAQVILFLASDAARAIHGALLPVTGLS
ncbi:MAG: SDR family NAD(P)-dependent oxidoreductase [Janthinobacterium lividum]